MFIQIEVETWHCQLFFNFFSSINLRSYRKTCLWEACTFITYQAYELWMWSNAECHRRPDKGSTEQFIYYSRAYGMHKLWLATPDVEYNLMDLIMQG